MRKFLFCCILLCTTTLFSQSKSFEISGIVKDSTQVLESATVYLEKAKDSSLVTYTISDKKGEFKLQGKTQETNLLLKISFIGYGTYQKKITLNNQKINLGFILLKPANMLDEITIKSSAPITIKKDTLEFNVKSFKTKKDANVEDLLKKLPGVEIGEDGKIKVNGKEVNKILVNGKPFFGNDPTITTRNLSKEIIEKVQITDTKTKSEAFSGEQGSDSNKTINLTIKKENNKGVFGRVSGGVGTRDTYEFASMFNHFDNDKRFSILLGGNNTNSPGFSFGEIQKMFGGGGFFSVSSSGGSSFRVGGMNFGGGQGIVTSKNAGMTYANTLTKEVEMNADYFYSESNSDYESSNNRENILPDDRYFSESYSKQDSENKNHTANMDFDIELDSTLLINIRPRFNFNNQKSSSVNNQEFRSIDNSLLSKSDVSSFSEGDGNRFQTDFDITKRFKKKGSFLRFSFTTEVNKDKSKSYKKSLTETFKVTPTVENLNQLSDNNENYNNIQSSITYRKPLSKELFFDLKYSILSDKREKELSTYDFNSATQKHDLFNNIFSSDFIYKNLRQTPSIELTYRKKKWSAGAEVGYVFRTIESEDFLRPQLTLSRNFKALELDSYFRYRFSPKMRMSIGYDLRNRPPSISQVSPFEDNSDRLNIRTGNPNLEPENNHEIYLSFNNFNFQTQTGFFFYARSEFVDNQIVSKSTIDENRIRKSTYENVDGNSNSYISGSFSKKYKLGETKSLQYRLGLFASYNRSISFLNDVKYGTKNTSIGPRLSFDFTWKDVMELRPYYNLSLSDVAFDTDLFDDRKITTHTLGIRTATFLPKKLEWRNDIRYSYNSNISDGFQKDYIFWNSTLAYSIMKDKGTISLKAYDLLNQNNNARRIVNQNYIEDRQSKVLQQYFMLSFSWKFNSLGKKGEVRDQNFMIF